MKKLAAAVAFAFALSAAGTAFAAGGGPKATGGAAFLQDDNPYHIGFNAMNHNKKKKKPDRGHVNLVDLAPTTPTGPGFVPDGSFTGKVTCYHQEAKEAWFSGAIDNPIPVPGTAEGELGFFLIAVQDNGKKKDTPRDQIRVEWSATSLSCEGSSLTADNPITNGNIQVHKPK